MNTNGFGDVNNVGTQSIVVYNGNLYVGAENLVTGTEVWRYNRATWTQVNTDGFGDSNTGRSTSMTVLGGGLYVELEISSQEQRYGEHPFQYKYP